MRIFTTLAIVSSLIAAACGGTTATSPTTPTATTVSGTWVGQLGFDSTGSMMGAGVSTSMMSSAVLTLTQSGNTFSGTGRFPGYMGGTMTVSGTMTGTSGTITMTMPTGSMMSGAGCMATASGTFDMDDMHTTLHGTYTGANTCSGAFTGGQMSMTYNRP